MSKIYVLFLVVLLISSRLSAQYQIEVSTKNTSDSAIILSYNYFSSKNSSVKDTLHLKDGMASFSNSQSTFGGIYRLTFLPSRKSVDIIVDNNKKIDLQLDGNNFLEGASSKELENNLYLAYQKFENKYHYLDSLWGKEQNKSRIHKLEFFKERDDAIVTFREQQMKKLSKTSVLRKIYLYQNNLQKYFPSVSNDSLVGDYLKLFDFNDNQILFSPLYGEIVNEFLNFFQLESEDFNRAADSLLAHISCKSKNYQYMIRHLTNLGLAPGILNGEDSYLYIVDNYIKKSECEFLSESKKNEYLKKADKLEIIKLGEVPPAIQLEDTSGLNQALFDFSSKQDYTLLVFYSPDCGHCQKEIPILDSISKRIEVIYSVKIGKFAVCNESYMPKEHWIDFINKNELTNNYAHVYMPNDCQTRTDYQAYSNPLIYLLNNKNEVVARKINHKSLVKYFKYLGNK